MRGIYILGMLLLLFPVFCAAHEGEKRKPLTISSPPPELDKYYPPRSDKFEWVKVMHRISGGFQGAWIDAKQGDWTNASRNAEELRKAYKKAYDMSGKEWGKKYFKLEHADAFSDAVKNRSMKKMGKASKELGETCGTCHYEQYSNVWLKYYWNDVDSIEIEDPVTEKKMEFEDYKHALVSSFYRLVNDGRQGEKARAIAGGKEFIERYRGLRAACMKCHEDEHVKYFFVGGRVEESLKRISEILKSGTLDMNLVFREIGVIGKEGCKKCHLTHRMAIMMKKGQEDGRRR